MSEHIEDESRPVRYHTLHVTCCHKAPVDVAHVLARECRQAVSVSIKFIMSHLLMLETVC